MKTKILLLMCLFTGVFVWPMQAQEKANNANQGWYEGSTQGGVWCNGDMIDLLKGELHVHFVVRTFKNGSLVRREIDQFKGELTSSATGEVFKFNRMIQWEYTGVWTGVIHYNMKGDWGTKYSGKIYVDYSTGVQVFTELHAVCH